MNRPTWTGLADDLARQMCWPEPVEPQPQPQTPVASEQAPQRPRRPRPG